MECDIAVLTFYIQMGNLADARKEMTKTKEQLEEEKRISLSIRIKPLELDGKITNKRRFLRR